jgi:hypothetical protein
MWQPPATAAAWPSDEKLVTTRQLANLLGVRPDTVRRWKLAGTGPLPSPTSTNRKTLYRVEDVRAWAVGNVRPSKHWKGLTTDPLHELDDCGRAILAAGKRAMIGLRPEEREAVIKKTKRKLAARARYFATANTNPGTFEHELTAGHGAIDAEFVDISSSAPEPARQQQLIIAPQPIAQPRSGGAGGAGGHVKPRPASPLHAAAQLTGSNRDRELLEALMALPKDERPAF